MKARGRDREVAIDRAEDAGMTAAVRGAAYSTNPHASDPGLKLAWSRGHNGMRARMAMDRHQ